MANEVAASSEVISALPLLVVARHPYQLVAVLVSVDATVGRRLEVSIWELWQAAARLAPLIATVGLISRPLSQGAFDGRLASPRPPPLVSVWRPAAPRL